MSAYHVLRLLKNEAKKKKEEEEREKNPDGSGSNKIAFAQLGVAKTAPEEYYRKLNRGENSCENSITFVEIEKMTRKFKTHRCALDFDSGFVKATLSESGDGCRQKMPPEACDLMVFRLPTPPSSSDEEESS